MNQELKQNLDILNKHNQQLRQTYGIKKIGIFGSVAKGKQGRHSDLDMLVEFSEPIGLFAFLDLEDYLKKILKKKVDLVTINALKPTVKEQILKDTIYAR